MRQCQNLDFVDFFLCHSQGPKKDAQKVLLPCFALFSSNEFFKEGCKKGLEAASRPKLYIRLVFDRFLRFIAQNDRDKN